MKRNKHKGKGLTKGMKRGPAALRAQTVATIAGAVLPHLAADRARLVEAGVVSAPGLNSTVLAAFNYGEAYVDELNRRAIEAWTEDEGKPKVSGNGADTES